jgi:hypothetical protein
MHYNMPRSIALFAQLIHLCFKNEIISISIPNKHSMAMTKENHRFPKKLKNKCRKILLTRLYETIYQYLGSSPKA